MRILFIEDDVRTAEYVARGFMEAGHVCDVLADGQDGLFHVMRESYDVLVRWKIWSVRPALNSSSSSHRANRGAFASSGMAATDTIQAKKPLGTLHLRHGVFLWLGRLDLAVERWRTRQALLQLSGEHLHDIGLTRIEANREGSRGFWD